VRHPRFCVTAGEQALSSVMVTVHHVTHSDAGFFGDAQQCGNALAWLLTKVQPAFTSSSDPGSYSPAIVY
jgi:hypothetical protein